MEKHQFKPFDKVLARDEDAAIWQADLYSHYAAEDKYKHKCMGSHYRQCIPYNENTAHLVGTSEPYKEPESKVWRVIAYNDTPQYLTTEEFANFIKIAVINNKDVTDVRITYMGQ